MSITIQCPQCGKRYTVDEASAGKIAKCQACGVKMRIPEAPPAPEPPAPQEPSPEAPAAGGLPKEMRANRTLAGRTCPVCGLAILLGQEVRNCELCGQTHHSQCWQKNNGCGTPNCENAPLPKLRLRQEAEAAAPGAAAPPPADTRKCPFCGEDIARATVRCPFCREDLDEAKRRPLFQRTSDTARNALICGIIAIPLSVVCCGIVLGPIAIGLALNAKRQIRNSRGALTGEGLATAGLICGIIATALCVLGILIQLANSSTF